jgi:hypothetical protein
MLKRGVICSKPANLMEEMFEVRLVMRSKNTDRALRIYKSNLRGALESSAERPEAENILPAREHLPFHGTADVRMYSTAQPEIRHFAVYIYHFANHEKQSIMEAPRFLHDDCAYVIAVS